jgi:DNA topoisomerase-1
MELIITEKPSVAEKIAYALGRPNLKKVGRVSVFELTRQSGQNQQIIIVPAVGHLFTLKERTKQIPSFDIAWYPTYEVNSQYYYTRQYLDVIKSFIQRCERVIIATDYDLEGDLIGANIVRFLSTYDIAKRMKFSTLTPEEIREAYEHLEEINKLNIIASETRHIVDWMYGINLSRAVMSALSKIGRRKTLSIGRVQGPMLKFLVERQKEIESFKPQKYWELYAIAQGIKFIHQKGQFFDREELECVKRATQKTVKVKIRKENVNIYSPTPFDFTTLQTEAYRCFGFNPIYTETLAQSLYTNAMISYPRTASQKLPSQLKLKQLILKISENPNYKNLATDLISKNRFRPREGKKEDVHPAIFPTGILKKLKSDEQKLYDLIVRRFLACFAEPIEVENSEINLITNAGIYSTNGKRIIRKGWLEYYIFNEFKEKVLPELKDDEYITIEDFETLEKETTPPPYFTPATIIQLMEKNEIGTKTTRAIVLDTLFKRGYVTGRQLKVTPLGLIIYDIFKKYSPKVLDPELTRKLEREMEGIQQGKITQESVISETKKIIRDIINEIQSAETEIGKELLQKINETEAFAPCKCGGTLRILQKGQSKFLGCTNYPSCKITYSLPKSTFSYAGQCTRCGAPKIWVLYKKQRFIVCLNNQCPEKIEKLKRKEEKVKKKAKSKKKRRQEKK